MVKGLKCAAWSFTGHFCVCMYSSSLANGGLCFLFKLPRLFDSGRWVYFNFHFKFVFSFGGGIFFFSFDLQIDLCLLFLVCVSFFFLVGFVISFSIGLSLIFIFLLSLFWSFMVSVLMWMVVSTGSSMSAGLNLLDNRIDSFISVFCLVWTFSLLRGFFLILVVSLTFIWNCWNVFLDCLFCDHF